MGINTRPRGVDFLRDALSPRLPLVSGGGGGGGGYVLDSVSGAASAWSVRLLTTAYSGPLFRVMRDSDSTELDIYPTATGDADTAALLTFVGSGNGYITKMYDQVGSNDVGNTGNIQIVNAGALITRNGVLAPAFPGSAQLGYGGTSLLPLGDSARTMVSVAKFDVAPDTDFLCVYGSSRTIGTLCGIGGESNTHLFCALGHGKLGCAGIDTSALRRHMYIWDQVDHKLYINGTQQALTNNDAPTPATEDNAIIIGNYLSGPYYTTGTISETIIFSTALATADISTLDASQSSYFGS